MTREERSNKFITFGCRLNSYESEAIKRAVSDSGQENLIVFNSCAVTSQAERQLRQSIRKERKLNPSARIVVTGCAAQIDPGKYAKMNEVDLVLGNTEKSKSESYRIKQDIAANNLEFDVKNSKDYRDLNHADKLFFSSKNPKEFLAIEDAAKIKVNDIMSVKETAPQLVSYFESKTRAFLEIQNGCNHRCTFCIIPFGRGNSRSVLFGDIVSQTRKMIAAGHKEIVLTGVDISDYGKDLELKITLAQMIRRLLDLVPDLTRLRLSSIDVAEIDEDLFKLIISEPRIMPYLHLSIQSGDDMILKRMKRRHNRSQIIEFCKRVKNSRPEVLFGADIIAGFPTEDEEMFANSLAIIDEANIVFGHIFPFSKREGTPASKMPQVKGDIIKKRAKLLREKVIIQLQKILVSQIGKNMKVIVEKSGFAKSENFLDVKIPNLDHQYIGEIIDVAIVGIDGNYLLGEIIKY